MIHIYTGNGKGKTTAAIGLAIRALGSGKKVYLCQFIKGKDCSELKALRRIKGMAIRQFGRGCFIRSGPSSGDIACARRGLEQLRKVVLSRKYDLVICDEICIAVSLKLLPAASVLDLMQETPKSIELVLTGRHAPGILLDHADLVSEVRDVRHYFRKGVKARKGIEF